MEYFLALFSQRNYYKSLVFFYFRLWKCIKLHAKNASNTSHNYGRARTGGTGGTVLHVFRRVLLDVRGIVRVLEVFVQLLGFQLVLKLPNYIILHVNQTILDAGSWEKPKELSK